MGTRGLFTHLQFIAIFAVVLGMSACGQDPSFETKDAAIGQQNSSGGTGTKNYGDSVVLDPENPDDREQQVIHCQEEGINDEDCFNYKMVSMTGKQPDPGLVDILWIVDNSGSMTEEQSYLGNNFSEFISRLVDSQIDFQVAVTTSDVCQAEAPNSLPLADRRCPTSNSGTRDQGTFRGTVGNKVLRETTPNLFDTFKSYAKVGINGSGFEHGLTAADLAVKKAMNGQNEAFIRDNSFLAVIVVSDEEDDGIGLSMPDPTSGNRNYAAEGLTSYRYTDDDFINFMKLAKGEGQFSVSTITGTIDPVTNKICTSAHSRPGEVGTQYISAATKTGGIVQSICETSWSTALSKIGEDLSAQITQIPLAYPAEPTTIKVFVNGVVDTHWSYIPASNAIKFESDHIPPAGANIGVEYLTKI